MQENFLQTFLLRKIFNILTFHVNMLDFSSVYLEYLQDLSKHPVHNQVESQSFQDCSIKLVCPFLKGINQCSTEVQETAIGEGNL